MRELIGTKTVMMSAKYPVAHKRAVEQMAHDNGRSIASELRIALETHLRKDGRIIAPAKRTARGTS